MSPSRSSLSPNRRRVLDFVRERVLAGLPPTVREVLLGALHGAEAQRALDLAHGRRETGEHALAHEVEDAPAVRRKG